MNTYTVFAVYMDNLQPFATTVEADDPDHAVVLAGLESDAPDLLTAFQVIAGEHEVLL